MKTTGVVGKSVVLVAGLNDALGDAYAEIQRLEHQRAALLEVVELSLQRGLLNNDTEMLAMARKAAVETRAASYARGMNLIPGGRE